MALNKLDFPEFTCRKLVPQKRQKCVQQCKHSMAHDWAKILKNFYRGTAISAPFSGVQPSNVFSAKSQTFQKSFKAKTSNVENWVLQFWAPSQAREKRGAARRKKDTFFVFTAAHIPVYWCTHTTSTFAKILPCRGWSVSEVAWSYDLRCGAKFVPVTTCMCVRSKEESRRSRWPPREINVKVIWKISPFQVENSTKVY